MGFWAFSNLGFSVLRIGRIGIRGLSNLGFSVLRIGFRGFRGLGVRGFEDSGFGWVQSCGV